MRALLALSAAFAASCSPSVGVSFDVPLEATTQSVILAFTSGTKVELHARAVERPSNALSPGIALEDDGDVAMTVLLYELQLDQLEIEPGLVPLAPEGEPSRPLPEFARAFRSLITGESIGPLEPVIELGDELASTRISAPNRSACIAGGGCYPGARSCVTPCPSGEYAGVPDPPADPEPPRGAEMIPEPATAALPNLAPCPSGWITTAPSGPEDVARCEPFPPALPPCAEDEVRFAGQVECSKSAGVCPAGDFAEELGPGPVIYVRAAAPAGGDGSSTAPLVTINEALARATPGTTIAVAKGVYHERVMLPAGVSLIGACRETVIEWDVEAEPALSASFGVAASARRVRVRSSDVGIHANDGAQLELEDVEIERGGNGGMLCIVDAICRARRVVIRGSKCGFCSAERARVELEDVVLENNLLTGIYAGEDVELSLAGAIIRDTRRESATQIAGQSIVAERASLSIDRAAMENSYAGGVYLIASTATITRSIIRGVREAGGGDGRGVIVDLGSALTARQLVVEDVTALGIYVRERARLEDVVIARTNRSAGSTNDGQGLLLDGTARVSASRLLVRQAYGAGVHVVGAVFEGEDLVAYDTQSFGSKQNDVGIGLAVVMGGRAQIDRLRLRDSRALGLAASLPGTRVELTDLLIEGVSPTPINPVGIGAIASMGAGVQLVRARIAGTETRALDSLLSGTRVSAIDLVIDGSPAGDRTSGSNGVAAAGGGFMSLERARIEHSFAYGALSTQEGSLLELTDVIVRDTSPRDGSDGDGAGVIAREHGGARLLRVKISEATSVAAHVKSDGSLWLTDVELADTRSGPSGTDGAGLRCYLAEIVSLERVSALRNPVQGASFAVVKTPMIIRDLTVRQVLRRPAPGEQGGALIFFANAFGVDIDRVLVEGSETAGFTSAGGSVVDARNITVRGAKDNGFVVTARANVTLARALIEDNFANGLIVDDEDTVCSAQDVRVENTLLPDELELNASGVFVKEGATLNLERFSIDRNANFGVTFQSARGSLRSGTISGHNVGLTVLGSNLELKTLLDGVSFRDNTTDLRVD